MTIDQKIALGSCIGTLISSVIILLTLLEMNKQRKNAYRPDLVFSPTEFIIYGHDDGKSFTPWPFMEPDICCPKVFINLFNIGMGVAKNVSITWKFDSVFFLEEIA